MKTLHLEILEREDHFIVPISIGSNLKFLNKTKANKFLRKYKSVINDNVGMLNIMQPLINSFFRQNIFTLDSITETKVRESLSNYDKRFEYIHKDFSSGNKNYFVFSNIATTLGYLIEAAQILFDHAKRYKNYALKNGLQPVLKNLHLIKKQLELDKHNLFIDYSYKSETVVRELKKTS